jgi:hypothetical protein
VGLIPLSVGWHIVLREGSSVQCTPGCGLCELFVFCSISFQIVDPGKRDESCKLRPASSFQQDPGSAENCLQ